MGLIFLITFAAYYMLSTKGTFKIPYDVDYFSPLARSFIHGRLDIPNPVVKTDLSFFRDKWYLYWGPLPALLLIPGQLFLGRYFPPAYLSFLVAGLSITTVYLIILRLKELYIGKDLRNVNILTFLLFFALGTSHLYIATRSGVWDVAQTVTFLPSAFAVYLLIKKNLSVRDYFFASLLLSLSLVGRYNIVLYLVFLSLRIFDDLVFKAEKFVIIKRKVLASLVPILFFFLIFAGYNFARFGNPFDFGFTYTVFDNFNFSHVAPKGFYSLYYVPRNLWYVFLEIPKLTFLRTGKIIFDWNRFGMSIFFVSPVFLGALLTINRELLHLKDFVNRLKLYLWIQVFVQIAVLVPFYWLGPLQVGIRYATDFGLLLLILAIFGLRGKINILVILGTLIAITLNIFYLFVA